MRGTLPPHEGVHPPLPNQVSPEQGNPPVKLGPPLQVLLPSSAKAKQKLHLQALLAGRAYLNFTQSSNNQPHTHPTPGKFIFYPELNKYPQRCLVSSFTTFQLHLKTSQQPAKRLYVARSISLLFGTAQPNLITIIPILQLQLLSLLLYSNNVIFCNFPSVIPPIRLPRLFLAPGPSHWGAALTINYLLLLN